MFISALASGRSLSASLPEASSQLACFAVVGGALTLPLDQVAEGYRAMDERRAIKTLLRP